MQNSEIQLQVHEFEDKYVFEVFEKAQNAGQDVPGFCKDYGFAVVGDINDICAKFKILDKCQVIAVQPNKYLITNTDTAIPNVIAAIKVQQRTKYCSFYVRIWCKDEDAFKKEQKRLYSLFDGKVIADNVAVGIRWAYTTSRGLDVSYIEEIIDDKIHDEAYPSIVAKWGSIEKFIKAFLHGDESVLILQGVPGTGKSRLLRAILKEAGNFVSKQEDVNRIDDASTPRVALYVSDSKIFEGDEIFAHFITGSEILFIVEDADHVLKPRSDGNKDMHRFLTISDGIIKSVGRKVIFTTNLPNIGDIDEALMRPGRCFAHLKLDRLTGAQATAFSTKLVPDSKKIFDKEMTLAEIYREHRI